jgi:excisionase family DNA binding protein
VDSSALTSATASTDEALTTGGAAEILGCSRQHVVDLCDEGKLAYTSVGRHRRVLRRDIESIRSRTDRLNRAERRSLWLAYAVAGKVVADPDRARALAREQINRMRPVARGQARQWLAEWERLLDGPTEDLLRTLIDTSPVGRELRQNSPFAGLLDQDERAQVLASWRQFDHGDPE